MTESRRVERIGSWLRGAGQAVAIRVTLALIWPFRSAQRMVVLAWLVGFFAVGQAQSAYADDLIVGPAPPPGAAPNLFESTDIGSYSLLVQLSDAHHGAPYVEQTMWNLVGAIGNVLMYLTLSLVRGALVCLQWMLQLNLYRENAPTIDGAVLALANNIFWPLFATTLAIAGAVMYARKNQQGGGSILNEVVWIFAASILAVTFAGIPGDESRYTPEQQKACREMGECPVSPTLGPSALLGTADDVRRLLSTGAIKAFSGLGITSESAAGWPKVTYDNSGGSSGNSVTLGTEEVNAVRQMTDSMWNVYAVTPWCYAQFNSIKVCSHQTDGAGEGAHYLKKDATWQSRSSWMGDTAHSSDGKDGNAPQCPIEWSDDGQSAPSASRCDWIRGQSFGRLGAVVLLTFTSLPLALLLFALVLYGVMAIVGFILLVLVGLLFLLGWMIPGRMRQIGVRWFETLLGSLLQSVIITTVLGAVMVFGAMLNSAIPTYGYFMVVLFHFAVFLAAFKVRGHFESITQMMSPTSSAPMSQYMAMRMMSGASRAARGLASAPGKAFGATGRMARGMTGHFRDTTAARERSLQTVSAANTARTASSLSARNTKASDPGRAAGATGSAGATGAGGRAAQEKKVPLFSSPPSREAAGAAGASAGATGGASAASRPSSTSNEAGRFRAHTRVAPPTAGDTRSTMRVAGATTARDAATGGASSSGRTASSPRGGAGQRSGAPSSRAPSSGGGNQGGSRSVPSTGATGRTGGGSAPVTRPATSHGGPTGGDAPSGTSARPEPSSGSTRGATGGAAGGSGREASRALPPSLRPTRSVKPPTAPTPRPSDPPPRSTPARRSEARERRGSTGGQGSTQSRGAVGPWRAQPPSQKGRHSRPDEDDRGKK